jgi:bacillithiol biosynthesis cysteine-adding enzyme BshC
VIEFRDTPLGDLPAIPSPRNGGVAPELLPAFLPTPLATVRDRLSRPDLLMVTTGQQPGLFTGPLYTIYKALSARALALSLERIWGRPVLPVFWAAGDDHDFAEAASSHWIAGDGTLASAALPDRPPEAALVPLSRESLPAQVDELLARLERDLPEGGARDQTLAWLRRHYHPGATVAAAFAGSLAELLGPLGVLVLDATHPAVKTAAAPIVGAAVEQAGVLDQRLASRARELIDAGLAPDVRVGDAATLAFLDGEGGGGRDRLILDAGRLRTRRGGVHLALDQFRRIVEREPERLSPNVLLRPVVESALLPTVAYLAGPGELGYLPLAAPAFETLGIHRPTPVPRWSGLLVEARVARTLTKFGAALEEVLHDGQRLEQRLLRGVAPADFEPALADLKAAIMAGGDRLSAVASQIDPTMERTAQTTRTAMLGQLAELEKRLLGAQKRRQGELVGQLDRVRAALQPLGKPQERVLSIVGFLGRYGAELMERLAGHIRSWFETALEGRRPTP